MRTEFQASSWLIGFMSLQIAEGPRKQPQCSGYSRQITPLPGVALGRQKGKYFHRIECNAYASLPFLHRADRRDQSPPIRLRIRIANFDPI